MASVGQTIARRVQEARKRKGWSQRDLAARLTAAGRPMNAGQVNKIEAGARGGDATRAENLSVGDLLVLAAVLGVAPLHLIVPLDDETPTALTGRISVRPPAMRAWIRGTWPLTSRVPWNGGISESDAMRFYFTEAPLSELDERLAHRGHASPASVNAPVGNDARDSAGGA